MKKAIALLATTAVMGIAGVGVATAAGGPGTTPPAQDAKNCRGASHAWLAQDGGSGNGIGGFASTQNLPVTWVTDFINNTYCAA
jgi:hypothetical protein